MNRLEAHEIATLFPTMSPEDRDHLSDSLGKDGQIEEIVLFEGKILDGRHRYATCLELGIEPRFREFTGTPEDAFAYSVALNLSRRHLTTVQRAAAGAGIKEFQARLLGHEAPDDEARDELEGAVESDDVDAQIDVGIEDEEDEARDEEDEAPRPNPRKRPSPRTINAKAREIASKQTGVSGRAIETAAKIKAEAPDVFERMLKGTAGSMPDAKKLTALPKEQRERIHALVDDGAKLKDALHQVAPPAPKSEGPVFLGKVVLEPEQARAFEALIERRGIKRADAAREAVIDWITKHEAVLAQQPTLVGAV